MADRGATRSPEQLQAPPLRVWGAVALVLLAIILVSIPRFLRHRIETERGFARDCAQLIDTSFSGNLPGQSGKGPRVIALGSSLLGCALLPDRRMEALAVEESGVELSFLKLARGRCSIEDFLPALPRILAARPDLLLVDAEIVNYLWKSNAMADSADEYAGYCRKQLKEGLQRMGGKRALGRPTLLNREDLEDVQQYQGADLLRAYASEMVKRTPRGPLAYNDPLRAFLERARNSGIRVVLLQFPRSPATDGLIPAAHLQKSLALRRELQSEFGVLTLEFPGSFPLADFRDFSHLNGKGAERYASWLLPELTRLLARGRVS